MGWSPVAPAQAPVESPVSDHEHRSVSQLGDPDPDVYVNMNRPSLFPAATAEKAERENHYMNILYNAVQRQGGGGSVETAMSPYMNMNGCRPTSRLEESGAVYAQPAAAVAAVKKRPVRVRSSSASRLSEISSLMRRSRSGGKLDGGGGSKSRAAVLEFKEVGRHCGDERIIGTKNMFGFFKKEMSTRQIVLQICR